jgi:hypothetical protein
MSWHPLSNGSLLADVEEDDEQEEGDGSDSDIEGRIQAKDNDGHPELCLSLQGTKRWKCVLLGLSQQCFLLTTSKKAGNWVVRKHQAKWLPNHAKRNEYVMYMENS